MLNVVLPSPQEIARRITHCPACNGRNYCYVYENTEDGFRLRDFSCEGCGADILDFYRRIARSGAVDNQGSARLFLLVVQGALAIFLILVGWLF